MMISKTLVDPENHTVLYNVLSGQFLYDPASKESEKLRSKRHQPNKEKWHLDWLRGHAGEHGAYHILSNLHPEWELQPPSTEYGCNLHQADLRGPKIRAHVKSLSDYDSTFSYVFQDTALYNGLEDFDENHWFAGVSAIYLGYREWGLFKVSLMHLLPMRWVIEDPLRLKSMRKSQLDSKRSLYVSDIPKRFECGRRLSEDQGLIRELRYPHPLSELQELSSLET